MENDFVNLLINLIKLQVDSIHDQVDLDFYLVSFNAFVTVIINHINSRREFLSEV